MFKRSLKYKTKPSHHHKCYSFNFLSNSIRNHDSLNTLMTKKTEVEKCLSVSQCTNTYVQGYIRASWCLFTFVNVRKFSDVSVLYTICVQRLSAIRILNIILLFMSVSELQCLLKTL